MWPAVAAFRAIVCAVLLLLVAGPRAHADRRPVAVVDLANEQATRDLAEQLKAVLEIHADLRPLPSSTDDAALTEKLDDPDADRIARAIEAKTKADAQIFALDYQAAIAEARDGQNELLFVTPSRAVKPYADLSYVLGVALFNDGRLTDAKVAFAQAYRLDPSRVLEAGRVLPEIVQAYADAKAAPAAQGAIEVTGMGNVWIDGTEVGIAPGTFSTTEGEHVVWRTGIDRETRGLRVAVVAAKPVLAEIPNVEASRRAKVQRAREILARAPDPSARAAAMKRLADLVGVKDAVLLSMTNTRVILQTWHDGPGDVARGFSALRERGTEKVDRLLVPLAPDRKPIERDPEPVPIPVVKKTFLERRPVQLGLALTVAAAIVAGVLWATRDPGTFMFDPNLQNEGLAR